MLKFKLLGILNYGLPNTVKIGFFVRQCTLQEIIKAIFFLLGIFLKKKKKQ